ncbi:hypothetical protein Droror1_Dr00006750 [Drosera rotundifolia]
MTMMVSGKICAAVPPLSSPETLNTPNRRLSTAAVISASEFRALEMGNTSNPILHQLCPLIASPSPPQIDRFRVGIVRFASSDRGSTRAFLDSNHLDVSYRAWTWAGWVIFVYLYSLCLGAKAIENPPLSISYPCEDVQDYYARAEHLTGEALRKQLNSIVPCHTKRFSLFPDVRL